MSFAATLGLVALVQIGMPNLFASPDHLATARIALWGGRELVMLLMASLIAGLATTPYAAFHFHRVSHIGIEHMRVAQRRLDVAMVECLLHQLEIAGLA